MNDFIERIPSELQDLESEATIYNIANYPADYTLEVLHERWKKNEILIPEFQRGFVWSISQASKLIESFLLGLPVPSVFLYKEHKSQKLLVIDGLQRLRSAFGYFEGQFPASRLSFALRGVHKKWQGKLYSELEEPDRRRLRDSVLRTVIVEQLDPKDNTSIYHIFYRLNTGATVLKAQETRNCIYHGIFNDMLKKLNELEDWRVIIGLPRADRRMRDIELILRFLTLKFRSREYKKPMRDFLSTFMNDFRNDQVKVLEFANTFTGCCAMIRKHLGSKLFRLRAALNVAVLDSVMVTFALNHQAIPSDIKHRYERLLENHKFIEVVSAGTTDEIAVRQRLILAKQVLFGE